LGFTLAALCLGTLALDQISGISASWFYCSSIMVIGAGISAVMLLRHRFRFALYAGIGFLGSVLVLHFCDTTPVKPFRRLDAAVQNGMTLAEVRSAEQLEFPEHGRFPVPVGFDSVPELGISQKWIAISGRFHMIVSFFDGRVIDKRSDLTPISDMILPKIVALVAVWVGFMCWQSARRVAGVKPPMGYGIDVRPVAERLQSVRRDHLGEYRTRHKVACLRKGLLASAGLAVRRSPYFRGRASEGSQNPEDEREKA
jgi:hypothetical protein